jgi:opacity protein-like surface antigen
MRALYPLIVVGVIAGLVDEATAADIGTAYLRGSESAAVPIAAVPRAWSWTGFYLGGQVGGAAGSATFADPAGPSIFGDDVTTPGFLAGGEIGYNWQLPNSNWVLGVDAAANWLAADGTNTCLASSGLFVSANCRAQPDMTGELAARVGWSYGYFSHSLLYIKGGAAFVRNRVDIATNATGDFAGLNPLTTSSSFTKVGWTVGTGVEHAITPAWSVKLEYDYISVGGETVATPPGLLQPIPGVGLYDLTPAGTTRVTQNIQQAALGLNYKIGMNPSAQWGLASSASLPRTAPVIALAPGWELEVGARSWFSSGKFQKDLGTATDPGLANILNSRLTYVTPAYSGELFGRVELPQSVFVKGDIGVGSLSGDHMNDEDWVLFGGAVAYSNTLSDLVEGNIGYATLDLGYDFFRGAGYKLGAFVGYNYYKEDKSAYGCTQIANSLSDCAPAIPDSVLAITENDTWNSLRAGVNGEIMITDHLKLGTDVAYLPYAKFEGTDDHVLRSLIIQESGKGEGLQLESIFSYMITDQFSVGVGGRYWSMWTTKDAIADFSGTPCPCQTQPAKTDRYGVFLQVDYKGIGTPSEGFR